MRLNLLILFAFFCAKLTFVSASTLIHTAMKSDALHREWKYSLYLPDGYDANSSKEYPVLYLLHGMYADQRHWFANGLQGILDREIANKRLPQTIVVAPDGGRYSWWVDSPVYGDLEEAFFADFIPTIERLYNIDGSRDKRAIGGISMGGYAAVRYAMLQPDLFISATLFSPALYESIGHEEPHERAYPFGWLGKLIWVNTESRGVFGKPFNNVLWQEKSYTKLYNDYKASNFNVRFYMYYGNKDDICDTSMQNFIDFMQENKEFLETQVFEGAHIWSVWRDAMPHAFRKKIFGRRP